MSTSIYTIRVQGADGRIVPSSFKASSRAAAENMALARGYDVIVAEDDAAEPTPEAPDADEAHPDHDDDASPAAAQWQVSASDASEDEDVTAPFEDSPSTSESVMADDSAPAHPGAPWAWWSWLMPLLAVIALMLLGQIGVRVPDDPIVSMVIALVVILPILVGIILGIVAIRKARRSPLRQGLTHGIFGLVLSLILAVPISAALLLPVLHNVKRQAVLTRIVASELASLPQRMDAQRSVIGYASRNGALVRTVLVTGDQPPAQGLTVAAEAHRIAVEATLALSRPDLVRLLTTRRIRLIDDLVWAEGAAPAIAVEFPAQVWVAAPTPTP